MSNDNLPDVPWALGEYWPPADIKLEQLAIQLYEADGFMLCMYRTGAESWPHDREGVRQQYREKARKKLITLGLRS